jgi:hypothetical protein
VVLGAIRHNRHQQTEATPTVAFFCECRTDAKCRRIGARSAETIDTIIDMMPQPEPSAQEVLAGLVERVTYHNAENGFCVLRAKARGLVGLGERNQHLVGARSGH